MQGAVAAGYHQRKLVKLVFAGSWRFSSISSAPVKYRVDAFQALTLTKKVLDT
jgi:hypothetical protein